jgi:hypothetical protein
MIDPAQIPDEVVEAAVFEWAGSEGTVANGIRAAIAAALNAWPSLEVFIFPAAMEKEGEQKRLGPEFEAAIFSDVEGLYEADKPEGEA